MASEYEDSVIEADSSGSDQTDSNTIATDFASIASTIPNYVYQNGRRYHSHHPDQYILPNDEREQERLDFIHHIFRLTLDGELCYAKLDNPQRILDIGTGTGIVRIDGFNSKFPPLPGNTKLVEGGQSDG
ncbi:hypothetical protein PRK78_004522 [Emydomyces testavorans]|uniref:Methyltransferase n=1 Tax=Emydomyces testavorans TaxID=2070801 RepID=A0AAF0ILQ6_9EURO|nr:hypothetical protein PRK78_004522 [Emydomyces testavorans]